MPKSPLEKALYDLIKEALKDAYYDLQSGAEEVAPADGQPEVNSAQEAPKRVRRTKEQIAADEAAAKKSEPVKAVAKVTYEQLASVVLDYVTQHGKPAAVKILNQFGVDKAQALQPEQWQEALELFKGNAEDGDIA